VARLIATEAPTETAVLVYINQDDADDSVVEDELEGLCEAADVRPIASLRQRLDRPYKKAYIGSGKVDELAALCKESEASLVILDAEITGIQHRNLEEATECRVVDRTQLILDIFARRAKTREGMLQVELAQLTTMLPKLMSVYTKFERQRGGIGMRGPGETKLESDRRMVRDKIDRLKDEIDEVKRGRDQQRASRRKNPFPFASIAGYTSAGKSTLMNRLAGTELLADAMPFATLDPTTRKVDLPNGYAVFLTDTVGFIRNLPTGLVAAFHSTLEEVAFSDFILHVVDLGNPAWESQKDAVIDTLRTLGAGEKPIITIFNKIDSLPDKHFATEIVSATENSVAISALSGEGLHDLQVAMLKQVQSLLRAVKVLIPYDQQNLLQECYDFGRVQKVEYREDGIYVEGDLVAELSHKLGRYSI
jgi:GTP-binding protein HflX